MCGNNREQTEGSEHKDRTANRILRHSFSFESVLQPGEWERRGRGHDQRLLWIRAQEGNTRRVLRMDEGRVNSGRRLRAKIAGAFCAVRQWRICVRNRWPLLWAIPNE